MHHLHPPNDPNGSHRTGVRFYIVPVGCCTYYTRLAESNKL